MSEFLLIEIALFIGLILSYFDWRKKNTSASYSYIWLVGLGIIDFSTRINGYFVLFENTSPPEQPSTAESSPGVGEPPLEEPDIFFPD
jgi:hypothetical protein